MTKWRVLLVLAIAEILVVLDSTVMNVSISVLVVDLHTQVTMIQAAVSMYALTAAAFMMPALVALAAGNYAGKDHAVAFSLPRQSLSP
jgi:alpha-D-ribose 1-methylphosphonate 5-triphosphate synthase subunit PhnH